MDSILETMINETVIFTGFNLILVSIHFLFVIKCDAGQLLCASCSDIARPADCYRHMRCNAGEKCFNRRYAKDSGADLYELGCMSSQVCPMSHQPIIGKRQQGVHLKCLSCCNDTALCNQDSGCKPPVAVAGTTLATLTQVRDCKDILDLGISRHDSVQIISLGTSKKSVYCDMTTDEGGWTVILYRRDGKVDFLHRDSHDYSLGFGSKYTDFWQGLEDMHALTSDGRRYQLRVDLQAANGTHYYEIYDDFYIGPANNFTLHAGSHRGTAAPLTYPQFVTVSPHTDQSDRVHWRGIGGLNYANEESLSGYMVKWWKVSDDVRSAQKKYMGWIQETIVQGLQKQTVYVLRVAGWSGGGDGLGSDPVYFTVLGGVISLDPATSQICYSDQPQPCNTASVNHSSMLGIAFLIYVLFYFLL